MFLLIVECFSFMGIAYATIGTGGVGGSAGLNGTSGTDASGAKTPTDGAGGGGGGGGGAGGDGGDGAGGGVLIDAGTSITISGSIESMGGDGTTNAGGTVKLFYLFGTDPDTSGIVSGRLYEYVYEWPVAPTLMEPVNGATSVNVLPTFKLRSYDPDSDYIRYKIQICDTNDCSSIVRTIDQTSSQIGWTAQSLQSGTAYSGDQFNQQNAIFQYQPTALSGNIQYWWRAQAIDPAGTNVWSDYSAISTFTTGESAANRPTVNIKGNANIGGNVIIKP